MKTVVSSEKDFAGKLVWDLEGLHERGNVGFWQPNPFGEIPNNYALLWRCSGCGEEASTPTWYCCNCGAMMLNKKETDIIDRRYVEVLKNGTNND